MNIVDSEKLITLHNSALDMTIFVFEIFQHKLSIKLFQQMSQTRSSVGVKNDGFKIRVDDTS